MSDAGHKNEIAVGQLLGSAALAARLQTCRIGIWSTSASHTPSGLLLAEALGDVLGRLWRNFDAAGPLARTVLQAARQAAESGEQLLSAEERWNPPYDVTLAMGTDLPPGSGLGFRIGGTGWKAMIGPTAFVDHDTNPVGPAAAAAIAALEVFKVVFADALGGRSRQLPSEWVWSAWDYGRNGPAPDPEPLLLDDVHIIGVGAVTHGLLWLLERWPAEVRGTMHLIDQDIYDHSNGQRYAGMRPEDVGQPKPMQAAQRLRSRHPSLTVVDHNRQDMNQYFEQMRPDCCVRLAVAGVDSPEHRRQLALKLPQRVVNMWTEGEWLGAARFGMGDGWPCLFCAYSEDTTAPMDETGQLAAETGLNPARVRDLLFSGAGLTPDDIAVIAQKYALSSQQVLVGKPLRSIRGVLCATGRLSLPEASSDADVPFAFSSLLAGIGGFVELVRELWGGASEPGHWQFRVFSYLVPNNWDRRQASSGCYLCGDALAQQIIRGKYG